MTELVIDSFAGGGGASEGIRAALGRDPDIAVNHDRLALAMHRMNHPGTHHIAEDVVTLDARTMCAGRPIGMLWMSPDCKHHSKAKGGKPRDKNIRGLAWTVLGWVNKLPKWQRPRVVFLENVEEFADWGPLAADGRPCPLQRGATFRAYVESWEALGYAVEHRELRACDFGVPTIRKRLYWIARRDGLPIVWPEPTHGDPKGEAVRSGRLEPWRAAAEIIDWSLPCPSIFDTSAEIKAKHGIRAQRPLKPNTLKRIAKGTMRYVVNAAKPFLVQVNHGGGPGGRAHAADEPSPTMTGGRGEALVTPFVTKFNRGATGHAVDEPLHTITSHASDTHGGGAAPLGIVAPMLVGCGGRAGQSPPRSGEMPAGTLTAKADTCLVAPHLIRVDQTSGDAARKGVHSVEEPVRTLATAGGMAVVAPYLVRTAHGEQDQAGHRRGRGDLSIEEPAPTVLASNDAALIAPFLAPRYQEKNGDAPRVRSVEEPAATIIGGDNVPGHLAAVHLSRQFGVSIGSAAEDPVGTITAGGAGKAAVVAAFLAQHNTDRAPKPGRPADEPLSTITATGGQTGVITAFLAQNNYQEPGHDAREPLSTIVAKGSTQSVVAAHLTHAFTSNTGGGQGDLTKPIKTILAGGQHAAAVCAFLAKYYGAGEPVQGAGEPLHTVTAKPRHGVVTVTIGGEPFVIVDIGMRMLTTRERFNAQGFRRDYVIDTGLLDDGTTVPFTLEQQGRFCGNSVCPAMAEALVRMNYAPRAAEARRPPQKVRPDLFPLLTAAE